MTSLNVSEKLFKDYSYYREQTAWVRARRANNPFVCVLKVTPERLKLFGVLQAWCANRGINPREWLYTLFAIRKFNFPPKLEEAYLCSEKHLKKFRTIKSFEPFKQRILEEAFTENSLSGDRFDPNKDLLLPVELEKAHYQRLGSPEICLQQIKEQTFGYHPLSVICRQCRIQEACKRHLKSIVGFDVLALRLGQITPENARRQAFTR
jgi:hypothetical protein